MVFVGLFNPATYRHKHDGGESGSASGAGGDFLGGSADGGAPLMQTLKGAVAVTGSCVTMAIYYIIMKPVLKGAASRHESSCRQFPPSGFLL